MRSEYARFPPAECITVTKPQQIGVSFAELHGVILQRGDRSTILDIRPGDIFANGRQCLYWSEVTEPDEVVEIYPDPSILRAAAGTSQPIEIESFAAVRDAVVLAIASILRRAHGNNLHLADVRASEFAHRLAEHLVTYYGGHAARRPPVRCLDRTQLDRVAQVVEERLGEVLTVGDMAAVAALSPFHFARAFKASTGMAPHEFVTSRRVERARSLLLRTPLSVAEVAYTVGFSNVSHFRRLFRRLTGRLPGDLRGR
jgi:AraC family transcriptional regulator